MPSIQRTSSGVRGIFLCTIINNYDGNSLRLDRCKKITVVTVEFNSKKIFCYLWSLNVFVSCLSRVTCITKSVTIHDSQRGIDSDSSFFAQNRETTLCVQQSLPQLLGGFAMGKPSSKKDKDKKHDKKTRKSKGGKKKEKKKKSSSSDSSSSSSKPAYSAEELEETLKIAETFGLKLCFNISALIHIVSCVSYSNNYP